MGRERTTGWLAIAVAISAASWSVWITLWAGGAPPWASILVGLVPTIAVGVAGVLLVRGTPLTRGVAAFLAIASLTEAAFLPVHLHIAVSMPSLLRNWWSLGTATAGIALAALALVLLRSTAPPPRDTPPAASARVTGVVGGLLVTASTTFAWTTSPEAPEAGWAPGFFSGIWPFDLTNVLRLGFLLAATVVVARARTKQTWMGGTTALLLAQGLAVGIWLDPTWQTADMVLAPGFWLTLAGQSLLALALIMEAAGPSPRVSRRTQPST